MRHGRKEIDKREVEAGHYQAVIQLEHLFSSAPTRIGSLARSHKTQTAARCGCLRCLSSGPARLSSDVLYISGGGWVGGRNRRGKFYLCRASSSRFLAHVAAAVNIKRVASTIPTSFTTLEYIKLHFAVVPLAQL